VTQILVIEDDAAILTGLTDNLEAEGYEVSTATDGETGYELLQRKEPDLVVLDLMLPKMGGLEVCRRAREAGITTPILMLTARGEETDRVLGLDLGADDYVTKPFSVRELMARIRAILRRSQPQAPLVDQVSFGDVSVDFLSYEVRRGDEEIAMTRKEFGVLRYLVSRPGEVVTRDQLLDEVWGYGFYPTTRTVDNHVAALRSKLETDPASPQHLVTVHGVGYKWIP